jgi:hypothetical protein
MERDLLMYDEEHDMPMQARNKALNEQLGYELNYVDRRTCGRH